MDSKMFFGSNVSCTEPPANTSRGLMQLEMEKEENGSRALELANRYILLRGGIKAN